MLNLIIALWAVRPVVAAPAMQPTNTAESSAVITGDSRVNLRGGPGTNFAILAKLDPGAAVTVIGTNANGDWRRIRVNATGRTGWVSASLLQVTEGASDTPSTPETLAASSTLTTTAQVSTAAPPPADDAPVSTPTVVTRPANMNVRGGPGTNYPVVTAVRAGSRLALVALGPNGDWYKVQLENHPEAWVFAGLTTASGPVDALPRLAADQIPAAPIAPPAAPAPVVAAAGAPPPAAAGFFAYGIQAHLWQHGDKGAIAGQVRDLGFTWVKSQLRWEFIEEHPGNINWHESDQIVDVMANNGINLLFSILTAPQWTRPDKPGTGGPPNDFNLYANFVGKVAGRYCGRLGAIEVWNEQNLQREWEGFPIDPGLYMDLLRRAYTSIKAACPSIIVVSGAPTPTGSSPVAVDDIDYLRGMYANGLARYSDGIGVHPSGFANPPEVTVQDWQQGRYTPPPSHFDHRSFYFRSTMEEYRAVMVAAGDVNKRLWPTEFGWGSTHSPYPGYEYEAYTSEGQQAQFIVTAFRMMREWGWVGVPFLWNLNFSEGEMAAFRVAGRPAYDALRAMQK
jgi:uncharacterized protein YgiM (DUF1202 family)